MKSEGQISELRRAINQAAEAIVNDALRKRQKELRLLKALSAEGSDAGF